MKGLLFSCTVVCLAACEPAPVLWSDVVAENAPRVPVETERGVQGPDAPGCAASIRIARGGATSYAAWWASRMDSSVVLMVARSTDGSAWSTPAAADSTDRGARGCGRFPPAISVDSMSHYVHLAYYLEPSSGGGVFFAHSMDSGATFHAPVPIVFGKNPSRTSVSSHGDRVVVAYEDPNTAHPLIGVALSKSMGHIFEERLIATSNNGRARQPLVRTDGDSIRLWWSEYSSNPAVSATHPRYRAGKWN